MNTFDVQIQTDELGETDQHIELAREAGLYYDELLYLESLSNMRIPQPLINHW